MSSRPFEGGSLKAPAADALRQDTKGLRSAAKVIAASLGVHENTAKNYLGAHTEMSLTHACKLAQGFRGFRELLLAAITPPDERELEEMLAFLVEQYERLQTQYREETDGRNQCRAGRAAAPRVDLAVPVDANRSHGCRRLAYRARRALAEQGQ